MIIINFKFFNLYICVGNILFITGIMGFFLCKNLIVWLICVDLSLLGSMINFLVFSLHYFRENGFIIALFIIILAAIEAALGLSLIMLYYSKKKNIEINELQNTKV